MPASFGGLQPAARRSHVGPRLTIALISNPHIIARREMGVSHDARCELLRRMRRTPEAKRLAGIPQDQRVRRLCASLGNEPFASTDSFFDRRNGAVSFTPIP